MYVIFGTSWNLVFRIYFIFFPPSCWYVVIPHTQMTFTEPSHRDLLACNLRAFHHWKGPQITDEFHTGVIQTMDAIPCC